MWEPPSTGYTKHDGALVLSSGEVVTDPEEGGWLYIAMMVVSLMDRGRGVHRGSGTDRESGADRGSGADNQR